MGVSVYVLPSSLADAFDEQVTRHFPDVNKSTEKILDVGAGTGIFGEQLLQHGFHNLYALDISAEMLSIAKEKNIYRKTFCTSLSNWREHFQPGEFDAVVACNTFTPGQMKPVAIEEIASLVKVGECHIELLV